LLVTHPLWKEVLGGDSVLSSAPHGVLAPDVCDAAPDRSLLVELAARSVVAVPVTVRGSVVGALLVASTVENRYGEADLALVEDLARRAAQALEIARSYESEHDARTLAEAATARVAM